MDRELNGRRKRRRRQLQKRTSGRKETRITLENVEQTAKAQAMGSRRENLTVLKHESDFEVESGGEQMRCKSTEESANDSYELKNFTYSVDKMFEESMNETCNLDNIEKIGDSNTLRPVPAPRKQILNKTDGEKLSSDTDKDITEIDLDDLHLTSSKSDTKSQESEMKSLTKSKIIFPPIPKPRSVIKTFQKESESQKSKEELSYSPESLNGNSSESSSNKGGKRAYPNELPLIDPLVMESDDLKQKSQKRIFVGAFFNRKKMKEKTKRLVPTIKSDKKKIPRISTILKDLKSEQKETKVNEEAEKEEDKVDCPMDTPQYPESLQNQKIYVQSKHGFYLMERDEIFKNGNSKLENGQNGGMEDSTVQTAILFQSYWSRSMIYFHGILAGFAFGHAATVTAIMMQYNYEPHPFIGVYSCLSLKMHYVFYALTALCIVSCFDRLDIGHMNRKHLQVTWKAPSMWLILCFYVVSFGLSFSNQTAEARFDSLSHSNLTKVSLNNDEQVSLLQWYHRVWARDALVLLAWLLVSLTKFPDFLHVHLNNMVKYEEEMKGEAINLHRLQRQKQENSI